MKARNWMAVFVAAALALGAAFLAPDAARAQGQPTPAQQQQMAEFVYFVQYYEAEFGPMEPGLKQQMVVVASDQIIMGNFEPFMAGLRQSMGLPPDYGRAPRGGAPAPAPAPAPQGGASGLEGQIVGMRVLFVQRRILGQSSASGFVHFCPNGFFYEASESFIARPTAGSSGVSSGVWRVENRGGVAVVAMYFRDGRRAGQSITYNVSDLMAGRWRVTNWDYAVDRLAQCS